MDQTRFWARKKKIFGLHNDKIIFHHRKNWPHYKGKKTFFKNNLDNFDYVFDIFKLTVGSNFLKSTPIFWLYFNNKLHSFRSTNNGLKYNIKDHYPQKDLWDHKRRQFWVRSLNSEFLWFSLNFWRSLWQLLLLGLKKLIETMSIQFFSSNDSDF